MIGSSLTNYQTIYALAATPPRCTLAYLNKSLIIMFSSTGFQLCSACDKDGVRRYLLNHTDHLQVGPPYAALAICDLAGRDIALL